MKLDSVATKIFIKTGHQKYLKQVKRLELGPSANLPNNSKIRATAKGNLHLHPNLDLNTLVFPSLSNESLLSLRQLLYNNGCVPLFDTYNVHVYKQGKLVTKGHRNFTDGLWDVKFQQHKINKINYIISKDKTKIELAQYLHACAFSPVISTFQKCIDNGNFITWLGIETLNFKNLLGTTEATAKRHINQERSNLQSIKVPAVVDAYEPFPEPIKTKHT